jgi:hypothetical protein
VAFGNVTPPAREPVCLGSPSNIWGRYTTQTNWATRNPLVTTEEFPAKFWPPRFTVTAPRGGHVDDAWVPATAVEGVLAIVVVGAACFPLPLEQPTTRSAKAATNAWTEKRFGSILLIMTFAVPCRFPDRGASCAVGDGVSYRSWDVFVSVVDPSIRFQSAAVSRCGAGRRARSWLPRRNVRRS